MSLFKGGLLDQFTSGGQMSIHSWRMFKQVFKTATKFLFIVFLVASGLIFWNMTTEYERHVMWKYNEANAKLVLNKQATVVINNPDGSEVLASAEQVANGDFAVEMVDYGIDVLIAGMIKAAIWSLIFFAVIAVILVGVGRRMRAKQFRRGAQLVEPKELKKQIKKHNKEQGAKCEYTLAGVPYPYEAEFQHTQLPGSTGKGKTVLFRELIKKAKANGDGGMLYAYTPDFVQEFYDPDKDFILNPFDQRCAPYSIFNDVQSRPHMDMLMEALIPDPAKGSDPFWNQGARMLAAESGWQIREAYRNHALENNLPGFHVPTQALTQRLLRTDLTELAMMIKDTGAAAVVDPDSPKTVISLRAILSTYMDCLKYLPDAKDGFSIRDWMKHREPGSFLFITTRADMHASLTPLISMWVDLTINALLSKDENREDHFWFFLDEIPTLHKLPSLINGMAVSRNFGGCFVLGYQGPFDLIQRYDDAGAKRIWNLCNTRAILNMPDFDNAKWAANNFGKAEAEETQISRTYGANDVRDGVSQNQREELKELVLPSEIMGLPDLTGYLRYPKGFPACKVQYPYFKMPKKAQGFVPVADSDLLGAQAIIKLPPMPGAKPEPEDDGGKVKAGPTVGNVHALFPVKEEKAAPVKAKEHTAPGPKDKEQEADTGGLSQKLEDDHGMDFDNI